MAENNKNIHDAARKCRGRLDLHIYKDGVEIEHFTANNLIVNTARTAMAHLTGDADEDKKIAYFAVGTSSKEADFSDTEITDAFTKAIDGHEYPDDDPYSVKFNFSLTTEEANGMAITEFGLLCADGSLFARKVRASIGKDTDISLTGVWTIMF